MSRESKLSVCPKCGGTTVEEWPTLRLLHQPEGHDHDPNKRMCCGCGYEWFKACPICGEVRDGSNSG